MALAEEARRTEELERGAAQEASAAAGEACKKVEEENGHLADEKLALVILGVPSGFILVFCLTSLLSIFVVGRTNLHRVGRII